MDRAERRRQEKMENKRDIRTFMNRVLKLYGYPNLEDPQNFCQLVGRLIQNHKHFQDLLITTDPRERVNCYESLKPYLQFVPWTLDEYIAKAQMEADAMQLPTVDPVTGRFHAYNPLEIKTMRFLNAKLSAFDDERPSAMNRDNFRRAKEHLDSYFKEEDRPWLIYKLAVVEHQGIKYLRFAAFLLDDAGEPKRIQ